MAGGVLIDPPMFYLAALIGLVDFNWSGVHSSLLPPRGLCTHSADLPPPTHAEIVAEPRTPPRHPERDPGHS